MKKFLLASSLILATPVVFGAEAATTPSPSTPIATEATAMDAKAKYSYSLGANIGLQLKRDELELDLNLFNQGIADGFTGAPLKISEEEIKTNLDDLRKIQMEKITKKVAKIAEDNLAKSEAFLEANKKNKGVITLDSGLQYQILANGKGKSPTKDEEVTVNYVGTLQDGREFDSSYKRNEPATFQVGAVIEGWQQALLLMKPGDKWKLYIPPKLGYGESGAGNMIEPNSVLIFEVELMSVKNKDVKDTAPAEVKK